MIAPLIVTPTLRTGGAKTQRFGRGAAHGREPIPSSPRRPEVRKPESDAREHGADDEEVIEDREGGERLDAPG
jgi:hypothetical protein